MKHAGFLGGILVGGILVGGAVGIQAFAQSKTAAEQGVTVDGMTLVREQFNCQIYATFLNNRSVFLAISTKAGETCSVAAQ